MRLDQVEAQLHRTVPAQHLRDRDDVAQRLRHLLAGQGHPGVVQPVPREAVARGVRLRPFVLVVREDQVHPAAVDVELRAEVGRGHRRALQVPAGPPVAPRRRPGRLPRLAALPQGEVAGVALGAGLRLALLHLVRALVGQHTVVAERAHREVDVAALGVGVSAVEQPLDQLDHLGDVPGRARGRGGGQAAQRVEGLLERPLVRGRPLPPGPARVGGLGDDLVVDVGDIADQQHVHSVVDEPATQHVVVQRTPDVPDVRDALHGGPADVHGRRAGPRGRELAHLPGRGVEQSKGHVVRWYGSTARRGRAGRPAIRPSAPLSGAVPPARTRSPDGGRRRRPPRCRPP